jgi:glycosyltransferase involved in cell wall biosynthesis
MTGPRPFAIVRQSAVPAADVTVSVIIPSYNTRAFVLAAIRSALNQTYRALEVIVVDDGSIDASVDDILSVADSRLTCVTQENGGLSAARNTGIHIARGRYVALLDSDDVWRPNKIARQVAVMDADGRIGVTFCDSEYLTEGGDRTGEYLVSRRPRPDVWQLIARNHVGNGSTPLIRRECFDRAGLFDEALLSCEDWELWVRVAALSGLTFQLVPAVLTGYRVRATSLSVARGSYARFVGHGLAAIERFPRYVPGFTAAHAAGARAQLYRVTSRKALSNGDVAASREFLRHAFHHSPSAVLRDSRAWALAAYHIAAGPLPPRLRGRLLEIGRGVRRHSQRMCRHAA